MSSGLSFHADLYANLHLHQKAEKRLVEVINIHESHRDRALAVLDEVVFELSKHGQTRFGNIAADVLRPLLLQLDDGW